MGLNRPWNGEAVAFCGHHDKDNWSPTRGDEADKAIVAKEANAVEADKDDDANKANLAIEADDEAISTNDAVFDEIDGADKANATI